MARILSAGRADQNAAAGRTLPSANGAGLCVARLRLAVSAFVLQRVPAARQRGQRRGEGPVAPARRGQTAQKMRSPGAGAAPPAGAAALAADMA